MSNGPENQFPRYYDLRSRFWRQHFEQALSYSDYLSQSDSGRAQKWTAMEPQIPRLSDGQRERLLRPGRRMNVLVSSGVWCGDCVRQGPILRQIAEACGEAVELRLIDRDTSAELRDELRIMGGSRVPVAVFLSEDFLEVGRFGDRMLATYRAKAAKEVGPACDTGLVAPPSEQLAAEQEEWVSIFERMLLILRLAPELRSRYGD
jgi:hypothetical protein